MKKKKNKSALKRARQAEARRIRNASIKSAMKTYMKKALLAIQEKKDPKTIDELVRKAISMIDKAKSKGVIHRRTASRKISRFTKKVNKLLQGSA
ncbi:MAG: 30S ribosomal protein S20 [Desulfobacterota bacterium]|nr:30S ribosomal protein S20 [Thermodesulfobacteriota bacterium]MDW8001363.1 30S ribosomal protein S20 [Deltaproteobacteria bacterium]